MNLSVTYNFTRIPLSTSELSSSTNQHRRYITDLFGKPQKHQIEKWGEIDLGEVTWINGHVRVNLIGFEMHNARYHLNIGLITNKNQEFLDKSIEALKASGLTEEELGK